ncbi:hypothetical protein D4R86_02450 [bacterium]|nr:MAG: hypothetical protein D4R86_02450 [bacterium]
MTNIIPYLINHGISEQVLIYVLLLPFLATLISFSRQVIGLRNLGVYHPLLLTFAFISLGIKPGLIIFLTVMVLANCIGYLVKKLSLLYLPRITIIVTTITLAVLVLMFLIFLSGYKIQIKDYLPIIIILSLTDKLVSFQIKKNLKPTLILSAGTLIIAIIGFYLISIKELQSIVLSYPLIYLFLVLIINLFLGKFKGLRLNEVWRFRSLFNLPAKK